MPVNNSSLYSSIAKLKEDAVFFTKQGNKFNGPGQLIKALPNGKLPTLDGSNLTGITSTPANLTYAAQEDIAIYKVVTSTGRIANSDNTAHRNKIIGIANATTLNGYSGTVIGNGNIVNPYWTWNIGDRIYLNGSNLSTIAPSSGFIQQVGTATGSDTINVIISPSILI